MNTTLKNLMLAILATGMSYTTFAQAPVTDLGSPQRRSPPHSSNVESGYPADTYPADVQPIEAPASIEKPSSYPSESSSGYSSAPIERNTTQAGSSLNQLQQLQEEIATLRGQVEEQNHAIQRLKQQHEDDMNKLLGGSATAGAQSTPAPATNTLPSTTQANTMTSEGKAEYEVAYGKLKAKDYDGATAGFKSQIAKYPNSEYSGNAHFWLGFIYQTKGDPAAAEKSFSTLIDKFPSHNKTPDAKYNLGKIYHQQGNTAKAKELLKDVAAGNSKSAPLAKSYLETL